MATFEVTLIIETDDHVSEQNLQLEVKAAVRNNVDGSIVDATTIRYDDDEDF